MQHLALVLRRVDARRRFAGGAADAGLEAAALQYISGTDANPTLYSKLSICEIGGRSVHFQISATFFRFIWDMGDFLLEKVKNIFLSFLETLKFWSCNKF